MFLLIALFLYLRNITQFNENLKQIFFKKLQFNDLTEIRKLRKYIKKGYRLTILIKHQFNFFISFISHLGRQL